MILSVGPQIIPNCHHLDYVCDLCRRKFQPDELIDIQINEHYPDTRYGRRQLIICSSCLGKFTKCARQYLGNLLLLGDQAIEEVVEL